LRLRADGEREQPHDADQHQHGQRHQHEDDEGEDQALVVDRGRVALAQARVAQVPADAAGDEAQQQEEDARQRG
jgi:hypothetical protein